MTQLEFKQFIIESKYFTKYEVILDKNNLEIYGYEALSRFDIKNKTISTEEIFKKLHHNNKLFFELEKRNKKLQIDNFLLNYKLFTFYHIILLITNYLYIIYYIVIVV